MCVKLPLFAIADPNLCLEEQVEMPSLIYLLLIMVLVITSSMPFSKDSVTSSIFRKLTYPCSFKGYVSLHSAVLL